MLQYTSPLHGELIDLVQRLNVLAKVYKDTLVSLAHIVIPTLPQDKILDLIQQLLLLPSFFTTQTPTQLESLVSKPPLDDVHAFPFRLLLDLREIQLVLKGVTQVQLLRLLDNAPSDHTLRQQLEFMSNLQEVFMSWSSKNLQEHCQLIRETPSNLQRQTLLVLAPKIQHSVVKVVLELFQLPASELEMFKVWLENLPYNRLVLLVNLLTLQEALLEVHTRLTLTPTVGSKRSYVDSLDITEGFSSLGLEPQAKSQRLLASSTEELQRMVSLPPTEYDFFMPDENIFGDVFPDFDLAGEFSMQNDLLSMTHPKSPSPLALSPSPSSPGLMTSVGQFDSDIVMEGCEPIGPYDHAFSDFMVPVPTTLDFPFPSPSSPLQLPTYPISLADSAAMLPPPFPVPFPTPGVPLTPFPDFSHLPVNPLLIPPPFSSPAPPPTTFVLPSQKMQSARTDAEASVSGSKSGDTSSVFFQPPTSSVSFQPPPVIPISPFPRNTSNQAYKLSITTQPPGQTVYQRILKPFPAVTLHHNGTESLDNLFVEASLIRSDDPKELPKCLEGTRVVPLGASLFTTFKKLKILATSQQQGTAFRIAFQLKKYSASVFHNVAGVLVVSNPIEVFSHTYYLPNRRRNAGAAPPMVSELIPPVGTCLGGDRVVILGVNFVDSDRLCVLFGNTRVKPIFHEANTLICTAPPGVSGSEVNIQVSNDGSNFCQSEVNFLFL